MAERGGRRQGTPGKGYSNRTDLNVQRAPQSGLQTAAGGGVAPPSPAPSAAPSAPAQQFLTPDQTPFPTDPTARPGEPVTAPPNLPFVPQAPNPATSLVRALMMQSPNPDLARLLARMESR